jgi:L-ascorbate metabolism protein UlaG (beta-lactamase superfamily)
MILDRIAEKQSLINQRRDEIITRYPSLWDKLIAAWNSSGSDDRAWLMYSANYLFRTHGVRWAIDPLELKSRVPKAPAMEVARDLKNLDFVLLTHSHRDHLDLGLLNSLRKLPIRWVVPKAILPLIREQARIPNGQILVPEPLQTISLHDLRITPFEGSHWQEDPDRPDGRRGVPSMGYLVEQGSKRWLFPGDTRTYDPANLPSFGSMDVLFAHLWQGKGAALQSHPFLLEPFCHFCIALQPRRIILTHLEEWGRQAFDFWDKGHADQLIACFKNHAPFLPIQMAYTGDKILL